MNELQAEDLSDQVIVALNKLGGIKLPETINSSSHRAKGRTYLIKPYVKKFTEGFPKDVAVKEYAEALKYLFDTEEVPYMLYLGVLLNVSKYSSGPLDSYPIPNGYIIVGSLATKGQSLDGELLKVKPYVQEEIHL